MFEKAIALIMAEPPELHYPAYYADLLREADVPDKDDGKCSEIPNGSDLISRQQAIDALSEAGLINYAATGDGNGMIQAVNVIKGLPSTQQETSILTVTIAPDSEEIERVARKIKDAPVMVLPSAELEIVRCKDCKHRYIKDGIWNCPFGLSGGELFYCAYGAERRTDETD